MCLDKSDNPFGAAEAKWHAVLFPLSCHWKYGLFGKDVSGSFLQGTMIKFVLPIKVATGSSVTVPNRIGETRVRV